MSQFQIELHQYHIPATLGIGVHRFLVLVEVMPNGTRIPLNELHGLATARDGSRKTSGFGIIGDQIAVWEWQRTGSNDGKSIGEFDKLGTSEIEGKNEYYFSYLENEYVDLEEGKIIFESNDYNSTLNEWNEAKNEGISVNTKNISYNLLNWIFFSDPATNSNAVAYTLSKVIGDVASILDTLDFGWVLDPGWKQNLNEFIEYPEGRYVPITTRGIIGAAIGANIAGYFTGNSFGSQLLGISLGSTIGGWVGDAVTLKKPLPELFLGTRLTPNIISNVISFGANELTDNIIDALDLDDPLEQIFASTLVSQVTSYSVAVAVAQVAPLTAIDYFAMPVYVNQAGQPVLDYSFETFGAGFLNAFGSAAGSYVGGELSDKFFNTSSRAAQIGGSLGSTIGSIVGKIVGQKLIPIPGVGAAIGAALGDLLGSFIGSLIDEDFPRAAYIVNIDNGEFVTQFSYELDDGITEIGRQMGEAARDILNFFASTVGGQLLTVENIYYGHYQEQSVYQLEDDAPGRSSFGTRVGFGENAQAAIEAGVVYQLTKTQIEGGDRYIKRLFNNYTNSRSNLEDFNELLQISKEYGTYQDNPALYQEYVNQLAEKSIQDADKRILDLRSQPWNSFVPPELNEELIKKVDANVDTNLLPIVFPISIEGNDLIINGERIIDWLKTQPGNKIQFLQFNDGSFYTINIEEKYQNLDDILGNGIPKNLDLSNIPKVKHATLKLYEKDPTIRDFGLDILPSQVSLSLSGNNLIINGEIIANWLTNTDKRLETLRFADGSRFKIVVENNSTVKLENELVANFNTVLAKAIEFNLSTPQSSDNYKGTNVTKIIYGNGGVVQGNDNSDDVLISSSNAETLQGGKGDDVYRYSLGSGKDTIEDIGGVDVIEFDSNIQLSNLQLQQNGSDLIINIINSSNLSALITDQLTIRNFAINKIEFIRLGNNQEYFFDNSSGQWQLKAANSIQTFTSNNITVQGTIGADVIRGSGENDTLSGGAGNDTYLYSFGDGLNTTIYDTGDYEGKVRDGGIDTLVLDTNIIHSLKLQNKDLIVTVSYILPSFNSSSDNNEAEPITITIKNWVDENSRIEFIRLANGEDFYPTLAADGSVSLQPVLTQGEATLDVQLDVPDNYVLSAYKLAVVDLFGNGLQLISAQNSFAMSDLDNDGSLEQTGWVSPADGILVIDQNNDGRITELNEFISLTSQADVTAISSLNSNGDRVLNSQDTNFEKIRIWIDANGNNRVELGELAALHRYGIEEISLASQQKNFEIAGNLITASTYFTQLGYEFRKRSQIFDVAFAYNPDGVKLETLPGGINKFNFENKPDIIIADDTAGNLNLTIDPTVTYSVTGGKGNDKLTILASNTTGGILNGGAGDDTITGGDGSDILNGGKGQDVIKAGAGDDTITVDKDDIITSLDGGEGFDIVTIDADSRLHLILEDSNNIEAIIGTKISNQITYSGVKPILISGDFGNDNLTGGEGSDQIEGGEGKDKLYGNKGNDLLLGGNGDDSLYGEQGDDQLYGLGGDDFLDGGDGNNILDGGLGNDSLKGGSGENTYVFGRNYGIDTITQNRNAEKDIISFKAGISPSDIAFWRRANNDAEKNNLYLAIKNTHDRLIITDQLANNTYGINQFTFADGTIWTRENIEAWLLQSTSGDDYLLGYNGNDTLDGGAGNDLLNGGAGNNTYVFGRGYGIDTIAENYNTGTDTLSFKAGINLSDIILWRKPNSISEKDNLYLAIKNTHDQIIIEDQFRNGPYGVDQFIFADGTIWTRENIQTLLLQSTPDDDYLLGYQGNNTLDGGAGNDLLNSGAGNNTYVFGRGYGIDTVVENYNTGTDTLSFKAGINPSDIILWRKPNSISERDNLYLAIKNTHDQIIIEDQFRNGPYGVDQFIFADGTIWTRDNIQTLLLQSTPSDDYLLGYQGNDTLDGGAGNDLLNGGAGNNTYIFGRGYEVDTIVENSNTGTDTLSFKAGISKSDIVFWRKTNISSEKDNLYLAIKNTNDRLIIEDQFRNSRYGVDQFIFADGTTVTRSDINSMSLANNFSEDNLLTGDANANTLENATGNDTLAGGTGNDIYIFNLGYGQDTIEEDYRGLNSYYDTVKFGAGLNTNTMEIVRQDNDLVFKVKGSSDRLTIENQFDYVNEVLSVEEFQFDNGAIVWTKEDIKQYLLQSTNADDYLVGYSDGLNNEILDGGLGNDTLVGGAGDDTYIFNLGYGQDTIEEDYRGLNSYYDTVKFGAGLTTNTMEIIRQGDDLVFKVKGSSDRLTIKDQFDYPYELISIEEFQFDNGAIVWTKEDIKQYLLKSTNGDDYIVGYSEGINNEILDGGLGNDTLVGGAGDDTYIFNLGYGQDTIEEDYRGLNSYYDTVKFGAGLTTNTMEIIRQGDDLVFKVKGSSDRLTIKDQFDYPYELISIEEFQFDNGAIVWTKEDIKQYLLKSTNGDDYIVGYSEGINNETLDGDLGDDTLAGGSGNDTYIFKESYGQDVIQEDYYFWHTNEDTVKFGRGLTPQTMEIVRQGNDLIFKVNGTTDTLTIKGQFATGEYNSVEEFQFDNGAVIWNKENIKNYVTGVFLTFNQAHYSISENGTSANAITINRIGNSNNTLTVTLTPSNGTAIAPAEFDNTPIIVNFASGETSKVVYIPIVDDAIVEGSKTLTLTLSNPTGGAALGFQKRATLTILDNDSENEPPIVEDAIFLLAENSADGTSIGTVTASDPNTSDTLTYAITTGNSDPDNDSNVAFAIDTTTGEITVADSGDLDFESTPSFNLTVTVTDAEGLSGDAAIRVNLTDIDENTPPIITSNATFQVSENTTTLGRITAEDADGNDLSFSISGGADQGLFTIDSDSGELSFKNAPDFENAGSANGDNNFQVQISVSDDIDTVTQDLTISVTDVDENTPPTITSNANFSVVENIKTVGTITAEDADGNDLTFSISGGADQALFIIDSNSGELSFNNVPDFENASNANSDNNYQVSVEVSDGTQTVTQDLTISVTNENEPPNIDDAIVTVDENSEEETQVAIITASDPENETLNFAIISGNLDPDNDSNLAFAIDPSTGIITVNDKDDLDFETNPSFNLEVTATDAGNLSDTAEVTVNLGDVPPGLFDTNQSQNGIFTLSGDSNNLKFILNNVGTDNVNEVGVFVVDDENGNVDGLAPSSEGYLKAALQRAQVVFSAISDFPSGFGLGDIERVIEVNGDARLGFYIISNGTTDTALADLESTGTTSVPVFFSDSSNLQVSDLSEEGFELNWSDEIGSSDFTDMELSVQLTQDTPAPFTQLQRETQKELIDLRDVTGKISISVEVYREAAFDNLIGFYQITDTNGGIDTNNDGVADFNPGQIGYKEAALSNRVTSLDLLQTDNQQATTFDGTFDGGSILAPFIVIDGSVDKAINNNAEVYFSFLGANSDGVDHIRLLGDNTFGFEDLPGGGDLDYNDMIIKVDFTTV